MEIISRKEAKSRGLKRYYMGVACKYGHIVERRTNNGSCLSCVKETKRLWNEKNKEYIAEYGRKLWFKSGFREKKHIIDRLFYKKHKDRMVKSRIYNMLFLSDAYVLKRMKALYGFKDRRFIDLLRIIIENSRLIKERDW